MAISNEKHKALDTKLFKTLVEQLTREIEEQKIAFDGKVDEMQRIDLEELIRLEEQFKRLLIQSPSGIKIYSNFIRYIRFEENNILNARPYFRESSASFTKGASKAFKSASPEDLQKASINILFARWVLGNWRGAVPVSLKTVYKDMETVRGRLITQNMPLAINQAKQFFRKVPLSSMEFTDMIGWCAAGLASGIDKWAGGDWKPLFRSVCIGRMKGNLIEKYSETMLHFYTNDRRILYAANAVKFRQGIEDLDELADAVNLYFKKIEEEGVKPIKGEVTASDLRLLMSAASHVGADTTATEDETYTVYNTTDSGQDIEEEVGKNEALNLLDMAIKELPILQKKIVKMKGDL